MDTHCYDEFVAQKYASIIIIQLIISPPRNYSYHNNRSFAARDGIVILLMMFAHSLAHSDLMRSAPKRMLFSYQVPSAYSLAYSVVILSHPNKRCQQYNLLALALKRKIFFSNTTGSIIDRFCVDEYTVHWTAMLINIW